jgi:hypothetical protein
LRSLPNSPRIIAPPFAGGNSAALYEMPVIPNWRHRLLTWGESTLVGSSYCVLEPAPSRKTIEIAPIRLIYIFKPSPNHAHVSRLQAGRESFPAL